MPRKPALDKYHDVLFKDFDEMEHRLNGEKLAETEEDRLEHRTDGTDAVDTLFIGMNFYGYESGASGVGMGVLKG